MKRTRTNKFSPRKQPLLPPQNSSNSLSAPPLQQLPHLLLLARLIRREREKMKKMAMQPMAAMMQAKMEIVFSSMPRDTSAFLSAISRGKDMLISENIFRIRFVFDSSVPLVVTSADFTTLSHCVATANKEGHHAELRNLG